MVVLDAIGLIVVAAIAVAGYLLWDRHRYRGASGPAARFAPTDEVFTDPSTGKRTRVYFDARTGRRQYRIEPDAEAEGDRGPGA